MALFSLYLQNHHQIWMIFFTGARDNCSECFGTIGVYQKILVRPLGAFLTLKMLKIPPSGSDFFKVVELN